MEPSLIGDCPSSPNCVSSRAADRDHRIDPIPLGPVTPAAAWELIEQALAKEPRLRVADRRRAQWYLRAEAASRIFGFVDDVEFQIDPDRNLVEIRSASRVGYWDLGVNRRRVERLRETLRASGLRSEHG